MASIDRKPADQRSGQYGVARQPLGFSFGQFGEWDARCGERIVSSDRTGLMIDRHKTTSNPPFDVLAGLLAQITIQNLNAAIESLAIVG